MKRKPKPVKVKITKTMVELLTQAVNGKDLKSTDYKSYDVLKTILAMWRAEFQDAPNPEK